MKFSKVICVILNCSMIMMLSGCSLLPSIQTRLNMLTSEVNNADNANLQTTQDVLNCFSEKDAKAQKH